MGKTVFSARARRVLERWPLFLFILPAFLYILVFNYKPMYGIVIAFQNYKMKLGIAGSEFVGFSNFSRLFASYWFPIILKNTLTLSLLSLVIGFPIPVLFALMVNEIRMQSVKKGIQTVSYAPHFVSIVVVCGMVTLFLSPSGGILGRAFEHMSGQRVSILQEPGAFKWVYVLSGVWQSTGWNAIIYFAALSGVDPQLVEAAGIDGASRLQKIRHINFPALAPTIIVLFILQSGSLLNVGYEKVYLLQNATNLTGSEVISTYAYKMGLENSDFSFSTATGLFNSTVNCIVLVLMNWLSGRVGETSLW